MFINVRMFFNQPPEKEAQITILNRATEYSENVKKVHAGCLHHCSLCALYLILHLVGAEALVDLMTPRVAAARRSTPVDSCVDDIMRTCQVRSPAQTEFVRHLLRVRTGIAAHKTHYR